MTAGFALKEEHASPEIRIWAPDPQANSEQHATMKILADNLPAIEALLSANRISSADFTPSLPRGGEPADTSVQYEMHSSPKTPYITEGLRNVREGIAKATGLEGSLLGPLTAGDREILTRQQNMNVAWSANARETGMDNVR